MSDMSRLTIFDGLPPSVAEPGEYLFYQAEPISVAIHFARHVRTATRRAMDSIPARSAAQRRTASSFLFFFCLSHVCFVWLPRHLLTLILMQAQATPQVDTLSICHRCEQRTWFRPCCGMVFCDPCTRGRLHERDCTVPRLPVLVPHAYITTDDGDRPPSAFVDLHRPEWEMYRVHQRQPFRALRLLLDGGCVLLQGGPRRQVLGTRLQAGRPRRLGVAGGLLLHHDADQARSHPLERIHAPLDFRS